MANPICLAANPPVPGSTQSPYTPVGATVNTYTAPTSGKTITVGGITVTVLPWAMGPSDLINLFANAGIPALIDRNGYLSFPGSPVISGDTNTRALLGV